MSEGRQGLGDCQSTPRADGITVRPWHAAVEKCGERTRSVLMIGKERGDTINMIYRAHAEPVISLYKDATS